MNIDILLDICEFNKIFHLRIYELCVFKYHKKNTIKALRKVCYNYSEGINNLSVLAKLVSIENVYNVCKEKNSETVQIKHKIY